MKINLNHDTTLGLYRSTNEETGEVKETSDFRLLLWELVKDEHRATSMNPLPKIWGKIS